VAGILDIRNPWRDALLPASYKNAEFHVEAMSEDNGRRLVVHEFPKKDRPYAEDMGRRAYGYTVRGYIVAFGRDTQDPRYQRDYTIARDALRRALDQGGGGRLQLPSLPSVIVAVDRYRMTEEMQRGGYCSFDMIFVEQGEAPGVPPPSSREDLITQTSRMRAQILANLAPQSSQPLLDQTFPR
jgi:prophage DNA circulation protein